MLEPKLLVTGLLQALKIIYLAKRVGRNFIVARIGF